MLPSATACRAAWLIDTAGEKHIAGYVGIRQDICNRIRPAAKALVKYPVKKRRSPRVFGNRHSGWMRPPRQRDTWRPRPRRKKGKRQLGSRWGGQDKYRGVPGPSFPFIDESPLRGLIMLCLNRDYIWIFIVLVCSVSSSRKSGWAMEISALARSQVDFPFRLMTPYSVTT